MQKNFTIRAMAEVHCDGAEIDVHNLYRPVHIGTDLSGETVTLVFRRDHGFDGPDGPEQVTFTCTGDVRTSFNNLAEPPFAIPENCVDIAYFDDRCDWDTMLIEDVPMGDGFDGLHFMFDGGLIFRVRCKEARVSFGAVVIPMTT